MPEDLMAVFTLHCDDSGTHKESQIAVAACFVADVVQWEHFVRDWNAANEVENFGVFHMAAFVAKKDQFALPEWQDGKKRDRTIKRLINIINTRRRVGFNAAVDKAAYDNEVPQDLREKLKLGSHYTFAIRMCMAKVLKWRLRFHHKEPIEFLFDQMGKGKDEIVSIFEQALDEGDENALMHGISRDAGWGFQSKSKVLPLQAADIFAWETLHHMQKVVLPEVKETPRKSYLALTAGTTEGGLHDKESLRALVAHWRTRIK